MKFYPFRPVPRLLTLGSILCFGAVVFIQTFAQIDSLRSNHLQTDFAEAGIDLEDAMDLEEWLLKNLLDLNSVNRKDINLIPLLSVAEKNCLWEHIINNRPAKNITILYRKNSCMDRKRLVDISRFFFVRLDANREKLIRIEAQDIFVRFKRTIESKNSYEQDTYIADPNSLSMKWRANWDKGYSSWMNIEKDAGEYWWDRRHSSGVDYLSVAIKKKVPKGVLKEWFIGDYEINNGQGLVCRQGFGFGKSAIPIYNIKDDVFLKPHTGLREDNFFRGLATSFKMRKIHANAFFSIRNLDATIKENNDEVRYASSIYLGGMHNIPNTLKKRNALFTQSMGFRVQYNAENIELGLFALQHSFRPSLITHDKVSPNTQSSNISLPYVWKYKNLFLRGEFAVSDFQSFAHLHSLFFQIDNNWNFIYILRLYQEGYDAVFAQPLSAFSRYSNEAGHYVGLTYVPQSKLQLTFYLDKFKPLRLVYNEADRQGFDGGINIVYEKKKTTLTGRYRYRSTEGFKTVSGQPIEQSFKTDLHQLLFRFTYALNKRSRAFIHVDLKKYSESLSNAEDIGKALFVDYRYANDEKGWSIDTRLSFFDIHSSRVAVYFFENSVLYDFNFHSFFNSGFRAYINGKYKLNSSLIFYLKTTFQRDWKSGLDRNLFYVTTQIRCRL